ncbi:hypothetical protein RB981_002709 [Vibrio cholerae]|jgi:ABC-type uncharacterized transport system permease subunit|uniref:hypothetical protein n=1 Tax=Vibrio cholerae TaxID=666 RepID=UPI0011D9EAA0|nr:hypothetical protein [Vibrio cholerae]ELE7141941.1 hypothetical protein [Vibrio cholerae]MCR9707116.1 hypothetical protein [Vibrio cholerae]MCR9871747.1 hypothetical protein [Vibrio cholerae]TXZ95511.1 hypothetical protein FXE30_02540 [Vibrio cholerae]
MWKVNCIMALNNLRELFAFRFDAFSKLVAFPLQLGLMYFLWKYVISEVDSGFNLEFVVGYYSLILVLSVQFPFIRLANDIQSKVITGDYFRNIVSGISLTREHFVEFIVKASWFNLFAIPVALCIFHFVSGAAIQPVKLVFFLINVQLGSLILFFVWMLVGLTAFRLVVNHGLSSLIFNLQRLCIGAIMPLSVLPELANKLIMLTPFPYAFYLAIESYISNSYEPYILILWQLAWVIGLGAVTITYESYATKKFELGMV